MMKTTNYLHFQQLLKSFIKKAAPSLAILLMLLLSLSSYGQSCPSGSTVLTSGTTTVPGGNAYSFCVNAGNTVTINSPSAVNKIDVFANGGTVNLNITGSTGDLNLNTSNGGTINLIGNGGITNFSAVAYSGTIKYDFTGNSTCFNVSVFPGGTYNQVKLLDNVTTYSLFNRGTATVKFNNISISSFQIFSSVPLTVNGPFDSSGGYKSSNVTLINYTGQPVQNYDDPNDYNYNGCGSNSPLQPISISGYVWNDINGNAIKANPEGFITSGVWVNLVDDTNKVVQSVQVNGSGDYTLTGLINATFKLILTNAVKTVGSTLTSSSLPAGFVNTGVNIAGTANTSNQTGIINVTTNTADLSNRNFGIRAAPCSITLATAGTNNQTVTAGTAITPIVYNLVSATGATVSPALPAGLTGTYNPSANTYTIIGTPTTAAPSSNYTVTATGSSCSNINATFTITVNAAVCYNDPKLSPGNEVPTKHGITLLKRAGVADADNWPMVRNGGFTALESNSKGFVITRLTTVEIEGQASPLILPKIANPQEGMMVYDKDAKCLKLYSDGVWSCFNTQTCP